MAPFGLSLLKIECHKAPFGLSLSKPASASVLHFDKLSANGLWAAVRTDCGLQCERTDGCGESELVAKEKSNMEAWMNDVPAAVRVTQRQLRAEVPDLAGRYARLSEALNDEVSAVRMEQENIALGCMTGAPPMGRV